MYQRHPHAKQLNALEMLEWLIATQAALLRLYCLLDDTQEAALHNEETVVGDPLYSPLAG